jgi:hypothetical protein
MGFQQGPKRVKLKQEQPAHQEEEMSVQQKRLLLRETECLAGAWLQVQLGPVVGAVISLSVNGRAQATLQYLMDPGEVLCLGGY